MPRILKVKRGEEFLPDVSISQLSEMQKNEPPGKPRDRLKAGNLRKRGWTLDRIADIVVSEIKVQLCPNPRQAGPPPPRPACPAPGTHRQRLINPSARMAMRESRGVDVRQIYGACMEDAGKPRMSATDAAAALDSRFSLYYRYHEDMEKTRELLRSC